MSKSTKLLISSYLRSFIVALAAILSTGESDALAVVLNALAVGVIGPMIRAINPKDEAFGIIANKVEAEIRKVAQAEKKKATKKK